MAEPIKQARPETPKPGSSLLRDFKGGTMFGAIKKGRDALFPVHQWAASGIQFAESTSKMVQLEHNDESWLATTSPEPGCLFPATAAQVRDLVGELRYKVVRWTGWTPEKPKFRRAEIIDTRLGLGKLKEADGSTSVTPCLYRELPTDEPLAKYLVLLPATEIANHGGRENVEKMPSVGDLEPSTLEIIKAPTLD